MNDAQSLKNAIVSHFDEYLSGLAIDTAADRGEVSLLLEKGNEFADSKNLEKLPELLVEIASVSLRIGLARGRFNASKEIFEVLQKWEMESN